MFKFLKVCKNDDDEQKKKTIKIEHDATRSIDFIS
jgi:hypothetical protein